MLPWCGQENLYLYLHTKLIRNTVSFLGQQLQIWRPHESLRFYPTQLIRRDSARNCGLIRVKWNNNTYSMVQSPSWEANWFAASQRNHPACERFLTLIFYREGLLAPLPTPPPPAGGPPLVGCRRLLIQFIRSYPPSEAVPLSATWGRAMPWNNDSF